MVALAHNQPPPVLDAPAGIRPSSTYLRELESLRGLAVLLVYAYHLDLAVMARLFVPSGSDISLAASYVRGGYTGVSLFFVISGFLLGGQFLSEIEGGHAVSRRAYAARRALRILPLYYAAVVAAALIAARQPADLLHGLPYLVFLNAWQRFALPLEPFSAVWWSLATEVQFYLLLPAIAWSLRKRQRRLGAVVLLAYGVAYAAFLAGLARPSQLRSQVFLSHSLFGMAPLFLFGALAAWLHRHAGARLAGITWLRRGPADLALIAALCGLGIILRWSLTIGVLRDSPPFAAWHLPEGLIWMSVLLMLLIAPLRLKPLLSNRVLAGLGVISYSIYMVHVPLIATAFIILRGTQPVLVGWSVRTGALAVALSALCLAVSWASYRLIERPFLTRKARVDR